MLSKKTPLVLFPVNAYILYFKLLVRFLLPVFTSRFTVAGPSSLYACMFAFYVYTLKKNTQGNFRESVTLSFKMLNGCNVRGQQRQDLHLVPQNAMRAKAALITQYWLKLSKSTFFRNLEINQRYTSIQK